MLKIRELKARDYKFIAAFLLLQFIDFIWTISNFEGEINPIALRPGFGSFLIWKAAIIFIVLLAYVLNILSLRFKKVLAFEAIVVSVIPVVLIIVQIIIIIA